MTHRPTVIGPQDSIERATREMVLGEIRHLPVVDRERRLIGVLSQRDVAAASGLHAQVRDLMATDVLAVAPDTLAHQAAYLMLHHRIGSLPVTDAEGRLCGIVTESDFVRAAYVLLGGRASIEDLEREARDAGD
jgi:CBS domain-containing protein